MSPEFKKEIHLGIAAILFIGIVGYSKMRVGEKSETLPDLNHVGAPDRGNVGLTMACGDDS
jgi:hypothetical protein